MQKVDQVSVVSFSSIKTASQENHIDEVVKTLDVLRYSYELGGSLRGMSGTLHSFDILCKGNGFRVTIDFLPSDEKDSEVAMIRSRVKFYDCSPDLGIIISLCKISEELKQLCSFYRFTIIEASDAEEASQKLAELLKNNLIESSELSLAATN